MTIVPIGRNGQWPLFMQRNSGEATVLGWLNIANTNAPGGADVTGTLVWEKLAIATNVYYPGGFTNSTKTVKPVPATRPRPSAMRS